MAISEILKELMETKVKSIQTRKDIEAVQEVIMYLEEVDAVSEIEEYNRKLVDLEFYQDMLKETLVRLNRDLFKSSLRNERAPFLQCV